MGSVDHVLANPQRLRELIHQAGQLIMQHRRAGQAVDEKEPGEIATAADLAAQELLMQGLRQLADLPIYSEEGDQHRSHDFTSWIVDPLDGTTPWVWGNSGFSVSIALEHEGEVVLGMVHDPVMQETFEATLKTPSTRNGEPLRTCAGTPLAEALLVVDWGNADQQRAEGLAYFERFLVPQMRARRVVPQFAPALGLCRIAEGRVHGLLCNDTWTEDHAAGQLIVRQAGGCISDFDGSSFQLRSPGIIAAADEVLQAGLLAVLGENG